LFYEHLDHALAMAQRTQARVAVFFLDLDGFKEVNNLLGHSKGDVLLQQVAERLQISLRSSDLVARLGGDEFAFVFENIRTPEDSGLIAEKILTSLAKPFTLEGNELCISGSIGISVFPEDGGDSKDLLRFADAAMYRVKGQGKHHYQFFSRPSLLDDWNREVNPNPLIQNPIDKTG
jgi:diguanylate cyclase (GGDEF)-like protein